MAGSVHHRLGIAIALALALGGCASYQGARLYQSGTAALDRDEPERAIADLERAAELVPTGSEVQNHLGLAYAAAGRDQDALLAFRRAVDLDCDNRAAVRNLRVAEQRRTAEAQP
jgi:Flp pilus assembly protein TadD